MSTDGLIPEILPDGNLGRLKWDYERERTGFSDLLDFGTADMDYRAPGPILDAIRDIAGRGHLGYPEIRNSYLSAIHDWLLQTASWDVDARTCISHNVGIYMSAWCLIQLLTNPGDRIVILTPVHFCYKRMIRLNGRFPIECPLLSDRGHYRIDFRSLESCFASGCRTLWLCNPHNPVGRVWTEQELRQIADICVRYHVMILSDDAYCGLTFPGHRYTPVASLSETVSRQTVTLYSTSKCFNTTGIRHSFIVTENPEIMKKYRDLLVSMDLEYGVNLFGLAAVEAAFRSCGPWLDRLNRELFEKHRLISGYAADRIPSISVTPADGLFFAWIDMRGLDINAKQLAYRLEQEEHMITENGSDGGKGGDGFIRMNLAASDRHLREGLERLNHFCARHQRRKEASS